MHKALFKSKAISMTTKTKENLECCPEFLPEKWEDKKLNWKQKRFVKEPVFSFSHIPVGFGRAMRKISSKMEKSGAGSPNWICLANHTSKWNMDLYVEVDKDVEDIENVVLDGSFYSKVYEGPYKDTKKWFKDYGKVTDEKNIKIEQHFLWYTYCPKCAKKYGKNYVTLIGKEVKTEQN